jgi:hypothetical protein
LFIKRTPDNGCFGSASCHELMEMQREVHSVGAPSRRVGALPNLREVIFFGPGMIQLRGLYR